MYERDTPFCGLAIGCRAPAHWAALAVLAPILGAQLVFFVWPTRRICLATPTR